MSWKKNTTWIHGKIRALSPIHHGGDEKTGSEVMMRRQQFIIGRERKALPIISGNSIRGTMRRRTMADFCERIGYEPGLKMYTALMNGGSLESVGTSKGHIDLELRAKIRHLITPIALLGMSIFNQIFPGKLQVGIAEPICKELNEYHAEEHQGKLSFHELIDDAFHTRKDDKIGEREREKDDQAIQMIYTFEVLAAGTELSHSFVLVAATELEKSCFSHMMDLWAIDSRVGGKSATGYGWVELDYQIPEEFPTAETYLRFVEDNKKEILELLVELEEVFETLGKKKKKGKESKTD